MPRNALVFLIAHGIAMPLSCVLLQSVGVCAAYDV